ncbi:MAG TPA: ATP-binding protein [Chloroflexi bacterium]|nr:ATP-binding protein [Chloroflexota bacterium]
MKDNDRSQATTTDQDDAVCPLCGGVGFVRLKVPVGHRLFGKAVSCRCRRREIQDHRLDRLREASNLRHMTGMTFDTFQVEGHDSPVVSFSLGDALHTAREFAENPSGWLLFIGPYGCGKTHLAAAIANRALERGVPVLFVVVPDLLDHLRAAYAPSSPVTYDELFDQVRNVELLILDDLGTQNATSWAAEKLFQILNYRYNARLPTVITTNQTIGDMDPRLASRLKHQDVVRTVPIYAADYRVQGKDESFGSLSLYSGLTFETFSDRRGELDKHQSARLRQAINTVKEYAEHPANWLLLRGGYGVGKTHLAAAAANKVVSSGMRVLFVVTSDLLDHLRATYQPGSPVTYDQRFNEVRRAWLLVLDDLGVQNATPWAQEKLFQILNYRYAGGLPTIITVSNSDWERLDERLQSRLMDASVCTLIDFDVPTYRGTVETRTPRRTTRQRMR